MKTEKIKEAESTEKSERLHKLVKRLKENPDPDACMFNLCMEIGKELTDGAPHEEYE